MRGLGDPLSHLSPTSLLWQRCTCRAPSSHWSTSLQAIGECLPTGGEHTPQGGVPRMQPYPLTVSPSSAVSSTLSTP